MQAIGFTLADLKFHILLAYLTDLFFFEKKKVIIERIGGIIQTETVLTSKYDQSEILNALHFFEEFKLFTNIKEDILRRRNLLPPTFPLVSLKDTKF